MYEQSLATEIKATAIGEWSICGGSWLKEFYCCLIYLWYLPTPTLIPYNSAQLELRMTFQWSNILRHHYTGVMIKTLNSQKNRYGNSQPTVNERAIFLYHSLEFNKYSLTSMLLSFDRLIQVWTCTNYISVNSCCHLAHVWCFQILMWISIIWKWLVNLTKKNTTNILP